MSRLLALTQRVVADPVTGERRDALDQRWMPFLAACGLVPLPLPNHAGAALALVGSVVVAGVLFTGGNDLAAYGGDAPERDETERALWEWARSRVVPLLGVCRGAQHLACLGGGALARVDGHAGVRHALEPGGGQVNSYHNFGIVAAPLGGIVDARAADGSIEAFRIPAERTTAIMWHPEREPTPDPADLALVIKALE